VHPGQPDRVTLQVLPRCLRRPGPCRALLRAAHQPENRPGHQGQLTHRSLSDEGQRTRVTFLGPTPNYSPWRRLGDSSPRSEWGPDRRAGPRNVRELSSRETLGLRHCRDDDERRAMTAGWFRVRVVGRIRSRSRVTDGSEQSMDADAGHGVGTSPKPAADTAVGGHPPPMTGCPQCWRGHPVAIISPTKPPGCTHCGPTACCEKLYGRTLADRTAASSSCSDSDVLREFNCREALAAKGGHRSGCRDESPRHRSHEERDRSRPGGDGPTRRAEVECEVLMRGT